MKVKVQFLGYIRNLLRQKEQEFEIENDITFSELLDRLAGIHGEPFEKEVYKPGLKNLKMGFVATINGVLIGQLEGVNTKLNDGDNIVLMSLMSGG